MDDRPERFGNVRDATDTETTKNTMHSGCVQREPKQEGTEIREQRNTCAGNSERVCVSEGDIADTMRHRLARREYRKEKPRGLTEDGVPTGWQNFPTQSPVRIRNDGISPGLVGITFPKHRNESIKAYGNAIVPQVIFQIFKSIAEYDTKPEKILSAPKS
jgi:DNA (cytosine-5)-methyltransferase 1